MLDGLWKEKPIKNITGKTLLLSLSYKEAVYLNKREKRKGINYLAKLQKVAFSFCFCSFQYFHIFQST